MANERPYTASDGILHMIYALNNGAKVGTGVRAVKTYSTNLMGSKLPKAIVDREVGNLNNLFGGYPVGSDLAPSILFAVIFFVISLVHLVLFTVNASRGHLFYISAGWCFIALIKAISFALRAVWSTDILQVDVGLAGEVLLILSSVFLISVNLILAQRLFTWRHPVGGDRDLFKNTMYALYILVGLVIVLTVVASVNPYVYFLSTRADDAYKICVMFSSILIILYSLTAISLLGLSYFFKPTRKDENLYTYQPWWIESFHPFYFVKKNAARDAEETFMKRNHNHRHAVRVIAATHHHFNMVEGLTNERGSLSHNKSIIIVTITTIFTFTESILRCIACFQYFPVYRNSRMSQPIVIYLTWGVLEVLVNMLYLIGRVDLRFYKPDILPAKVRSIITAEQSFFHSRNVSRNVSDNEEESEFDEDELAEFDDTDDSPNQPPRYESKKYESSNDNESDFNF